METKISAIAIVGKDGGIGKNGALLWRLPSDLQYFKKVTVGHPIIMGRKTYKSIGRVLPERTNIVLTSGKLNNNKIHVAKDPQTALEIAQKTGTDEIFIIGGAQIYATYMQSVDKLYLSVVDAQKDADVFFPEYDADSFRLIHSEQVTNDELPYTRIILERVQ